MLRPFSPAETSQLTFFYISYLMGVGHAAGVRQRAINTAAFLFRAFYRQRGLTEADPLLLVPTALFVAAKLSECPVHATALVRAMAPLQREMGEKNPYGVEQILQQERALLEELDFRLELCDPGRDIAAYLGLGRVRFVDEEWTLDEPGTHGAPSYLDPATDPGALELVAHATFVANDICRTDAPLVYQDNMLALAAIVTACNALRRPLPGWLAEPLRTSAKAVEEIVTALAHMYQSIIGDTEDGGLRCSKACLALHAQLSAAHQTQRTYANTTNNSAAGRGVKRSRLLTAR